MDPVVSSRPGPPVALKETCRFVRGRGVPLWPWHAQRLRQGGCGDPILAALGDEIGRVTSSYDGPASSRLRLTVVVESDGTWDVTLERRLSSLDVPGGPTLTVVRVGGAPPLPPGPAKPADRAWWDEAHHRAESLGAHQAALVSEDGEVLDGSTASVWVVSRGVLATPPAPPAMPGVGRAFVLSRSAEEGFPVEIRPVHVEELSTAEELFLTNAFAGLVPVRGRGGECSARLQRWFDEVWAPE